MGGGGLRILPHKSWHVWNFDNRQRVEKDVAQAKVDEEAKQYRVEMAEQEVRLSVLRERAGLTKSTSKGKGKAPALDQPHHQHQHQHQHHQLEHQHGARLEDGAAAVDQGADYPALAAPRDAGAGTVALADSGGLSSAQYVHAWPAGPRAARVPCVCSIVEGPPCVPRAPWSTPHAPAPASVSAHASARAGGRVDLAPCAGRAPASGVAPPSCLPCNLSSSSRDLVNYGGPAPLPHLQRQPV